MMAIGLAIASFSWYIAGGFYQSAEQSSHPDTVRKYMKCGYWLTEISKYGALIFVQGVCMWLWEVAP